jgi:hypothetical protein
MDLDEAPENAIEASDAIQILMEDLENGQSESVSRPRNVAVMTTNQVVAKTDTSCRQSVVGGADVSRARSGSMLCAMFQRSQLLQFRELEAVHAGCSSSSPSRIARVATLRGDQNSSSRKDGQGTLLQPVK